MSQVGGPQAMKGAILKLVNDFGELLAIEGTRGWFMVGAWLFMADGCWMIG